MKTDSYTLITGASLGIGNAMAHYCAGLGMNLALVSLPCESLEEIASEIETMYGVTVYFLEIDLTQTDAPQKVVEWILFEDINVNILINNAGLAGASIFETSTPEYIDARILLNVRATALLTRLFIPILEKNKSSHILNVSSMAAFYAIPYKSLYSATKSFILNFSKAIRVELRAKGINVSVLCPSGVRSNGIMHARMNKHTIFARWTEVTVEKVAQTAINQMLRGKFLIIPGLFSRIVVNASVFVPSSVKEKYILHEYRKEVESGF